MTTDSKITKLQTDFQNLSETASALNAASDHLTRGVAVLDEALKKLNVGLTVWVNFDVRGDDNDPGLYDLDQIGYCKINGTWGLAIRQVWGDELRDWEKQDGPWSFNDVQREMRLRAVDKIPEVIAELSKAAIQTTKKVQEKTEQVIELAEAITQVVTTGKAKSVTLAERVVSGQKSLTGKLGQMADAGKLTEALGPLPKTGVDVASLISPTSTSVPKGQK
jgi:hypothetical protein